MLDKNNTNEAPLIAVVDDDSSVRFSTCRLLRTFGFRSEAFESAREFLNSGHSRNAACLILDVRRHGMSGLRRQRHLAEMHRSPPIVFIAAVMDENVIARAMQADGVHFLRKPASEESLIRVVQRALAPKLCLRRELSVTVNRSVTQVH